MALVFLQPFLNCGTPGGVSYILNMEATYDWEAEQASVPVHLLVTKVGCIGKQMVQFGGGLRCWADSPDGGPEGRGLRLNFVFLFPK